LVLGCYSEEFDCRNGEGTLTCTTSDDGVLTVSGSGYMLDFDDTTSCRFGNISKIEIGNEVQYIGEYAFKLCPITEITFAEESKVDGIGRDAFASCEFLKAITIPNSVTTLGNHTFYKTSILKTVTLGESVQLIDESCFEHSGVESIVIPASVNEIRSNAFYKSYDLGCVSFKGTKQPTFSDVYIFYYTHINSDTNLIHVPKDYEEESFCGINVIKDDYTCGEEMECTNENCERCSTPNVCISCKEGYILMDNKCEKDTDEDDVDLYCIPTAGAVVAEKIFLNRCIVIPEEDKTMFKHPLFKSVLPIRRANNYRLYSAYYKMINETHVQFYLYESDDCTSYLFSSEIDTFMDDTNDTECSTNKPSGKGYNVNFYWDGNCSIPIFYSYYIFEECRTYYPPEENEVIFSAKTEIVNNTMKYYMFENETCDGKILMSAEGECSKCIFMGDDGFYLQPDCTGSDSDDSGDDNNNEGTNWKMIGLVAICIVGVLLIIIVIAVLILLIVFRASVKRALSKICPCFGEYEQLN